MELTLIGILRDDYQKILTFILREYLKFDKKIEFDKLPEKIRYGDLIWILRLVDHYRSLINFKNPIESEKCGELVVKFTELLRETARTNKTFNLFQSFTKLTGSKNNYRYKKHFYVCDTLKEVLTREPRNGNSK